MHIKRSTKTTYIPRRTNDALACISSLVLLASLLASLLTSLLRILLRTRTRFSDATFPRSARVEAQTLEDADRSPQPQFACPVSGLWLPPPARTRLGAEKRGERRGKGHGKRHRRAGQCVQVLSVAASERVREGFLFSFCVPQIAFLHRWYCVDSVFSPGRKKRGRGCDGKRARESEEARP